MSLFMTYVNIFYEHPENLNLSHLIAIYLDLQSYSTRFCVLVLYYIIELMLLLELWGIIVAFSYALTFTSSYCVYQSCIKLLLSVHRIWGKFKERFAVYLSHSGKLENEIYFQKQRGSKAEDIP